MKKLLALILTLTLFLSVPFVAAVNDSGLEWGIEEGDILHFTLTYADYNYSMSVENIYMDVTDVPTIQDHIDNMSALIPATGILYFENDTKVNDTIHTIGGMAAAMPIGNWSYLTSLVEDFTFTAGSIEVHENYTHWGYEMSAAGADSEFYVYKVDGSLAYLYMEVGMVTFLLMQVEMIRTDPPTLPEPTTMETTTTTTESTTSGPPNGGFPIDPMILLLIGAAAVVVIVIVVVALNRRK